MCDVYIPLCLKWFRSGELTEEFATQEPETRVLGDAGWGTSGHTALNQDGEGERESVNHEHHE